MQREDTQAGTSMSTREATGSMLEPHIPQVLVHALRTAQGNVPWLKQLLAANAASAMKAAGALKEIAAWSVQRRIDRVVAPYPLTRSPTADHWGMQSRLRQVCLCMPCRHAAYMMICINISIHVIGVCVSAGSETTR